MSFAQLRQGRPVLFDLVFTLLGSLLLLLVVAPLLGIVFTTSFSDLSDAAVDREVTDSIRLTLLAALSAVVACSISGIPLAYLLAKRKFKGKSLLMAIIDLPVIIPHSAAGIALLTVIGRNSPLGQLADGINISFVGTILGIATAMAFVSLPLLVSAAREGFAAVPTELESAARTLGASPLQVFLTISIPLAWRPILSGMIMMWARGISEFGAVVIIAYHPMVTPVLVYQRFTDFGLARAQASALLLILVCVAVFLLLRFVAGRGKGDGRHA
jgi:molybdate/tungstate transport system permease protein